MVTPGCTKNVNVWASVEVGAGGDVSSPCPADKWHATGGAEPVKRGMTWSEAKNTWLTALPSATSFKSPLFTFSTGLGDTS